MTLPETSDSRTWVIKVDGGPLFAYNAAKALERAAQLAPPGPSHDVFSRLAAACYEAHDETLRR